jgi:hypothetical protein
VGREKRRTWKGMVLKQVSEVIAVALLPALELELERVPTESLFLVAEVKLFGVARMCVPVVAAIELEYVVCVVSAGPELVVRESVVGLACVVPAEQVVECVVCVIVQAVFDVVDVQAVSDVVDVQAVVGVQAVFDVIVVLTGKGSVLVTEPVQVGLLPLPSVAEPAVEMRLVCESGRMRPWAPLSFLRQIHAQLPKKLSLSD